MTVLVVDDATRSSRDRYLDTASIAAGVLWLAAGFLPTYDDVSGFLWWLLSFFIPPLGIIITIANVFIFVSLVKSIRAVRTHEHRDIWFPYLALPCIIVAMIFSFLATTGSGKGPGDPDLSGSGKQIGVFLYIGALLLSLARIILDYLWRKKKSQT